MARQSGIIKIERTVDDLTFLKRGGRYLVRRKGGVSRSRLLNEPTFARTCENSNEFAHAAKCATLLRRAAMPLIKKVYAPKLSNRLLSVFFKIKNLDSTSAPGARQVSQALATAAFDAAAGPVTLPPLPVPSGGGKQLLPVAVGLLPGSQWGFIPFERWPF